MEKLYSCLCSKKVVERFNPVHFDWRILFAIVFSVLLFFSCLFLCAHFKLGCRFGLYSSGILSTSLFSHSLLMKLFTNKIVSYLVNRMSSNDKEKMNQKSQQCGKEQLAERNCFFFQMSETLEWSSFNWSICRYACKANKRCIQVLFPPVTHYNRLQFYAYMNKKKLSLLFLIKQTRPTEFSSNTIPLTTVVKKSNE